MKPPQWRVRRLDALTKAAYSAVLADKDEDKRKDERRLRFLPSSTTVAALILVLILAVSASLWRAAHNRETAQSDTTQSETAQSDTTPHSETVQSEAPHSTPTTQAHPPRRPHSTITVYVSGHVHTPTVITLPAGSRITDALQHAGGPDEDADLDSLNLARPLTDGEHIRVRAKGETNTLTNGDDTTTDNAQTEQHCVSLNTATAQELQTLDGIGPALASRILNYRTTHPNISSVTQLDDIPGIGPSLIEKIRPGVCQ